MMDEKQLFFISKKELEILKLKESFERLGYKIIIAANNEMDILRKFNNSDPEIIIINLDIADDYNWEKVLKKNSMFNKVPLVIMWNKECTEKIINFSDANLFAYLSKPIQFPLLKQIVDLGISKHNSEKVNHSESQATRFNSFFIKKARKVVNVPLDGIEYIEVESKYSTLFTKNGKFLLRQSLKDIMYKLPENDFVRVHRNYVVNVKDIISFNLDDYTVELKNKTIPLGRSYRYEVSKKLTFLT